MQPPAESPAKVNTEWCADWLALYTGGETKIITALSLRGKTENGTVKALFIHATFI